MWLISSGLSAAEYPGSMVQGGKSDDQKYAGTWTGTYTPENGPSNQLSYNFIKDEKGKWGGKVSYTNQDGEQSADLKSLEFTAGKMTAKIESPDGQVEVSIEGKFDGNTLEGTYAVSPKGSTEVAEKGSWKVSKAPAKKTD
jgi:hypothetical protein